MFVCVYVCCVYVYVYVCAFGVKSGREEGNGSLNKKNYLSPILYHLFAGCYTGRIRGTITAVVVCNDEHRTNHVCPPATCHTHTHAQCDRYLPELVQLGIGQYPCHFKNQIHKKEQKDKWYK